MNYKHECIEWDGLQIDESCSEIMCCMCFDDEQFIAIKDKWLQELDEYNKLTEGV